MMLMHDFEDWGASYADLNPDCELKEDELFEIFYQQHHVGKGFMLMMCELAFEIYQLQVCVEGLLEDIEEV